MWEGCAAEWCTVCRAETNEPSSPIVPPVFILRSKRGKLLEEISTRMLCPFLKTLAVAQRSIVYSTTSPGVMYDAGARRGAVPGADDAVGEVSGVAVGFDIDELSGEVCVHGGCGCVEGYGYGTGNLGVLLHWRRGIDQYIGTDLDGALIVGAGRQ